MDGHSPVTTHSDLKARFDLRTPSLGLLFTFWIISNLIVVFWLMGDHYLAHSIYWRIGTPYVATERTLYAIVLVAPLLLIAYRRKYFLDPLKLGLLVCCCLAISIAYNEANQVRSGMQYSLDNEANFLTSDLVEGVIRPLIAAVVKVYIAVFGDDHSGGSTAFTHMAINYLFDSAALLAAFSLGTVLLSPTSTWLYLFVVAFFGQISIYPGRMGPFFIAGGFLWQLFLLSSRRYTAAIICGFVISFSRTDVVFASAFAMLGFAWFERRRPSQKEATVFGVLVAISLLVPKILILLHPRTVIYASFLFTHGDYFSKLTENLTNLRLTLAIASPVLALILVLGVSPRSRTVAIVALPALAHLSMVFLVADFSETRLLIPALAALAFIACERLGYFLQSISQTEPISLPAEIDN
jgi:hypothetical protein